VVRGHDEVAKWLWTVYPEWAHFPGIDFGIATLDFLQWAVDNGYQWVGGELEAATDAGRMDVVQWSVGHLHDKYQQCQA
jgi:hypothetical protein